jgi:outer membrane protein assembly factor BamE
MSPRALAALAALLLASCGSLPVPNLKPYRIEIQQGNFVSQEMMSQLKPGMSKDQVRFVMGTPLLIDVFHADRWDYVYRRQRENSNVLEHRKIAVFFEDGKLKRVEGDVEAASAAEPVKAPEAKPAPAAAQASSDAPKPAAAQAGDKPAAASPAEPPPQEKSWWQKLKEKF